MSNKGESRVAPKISSLRSDYQFDVFENYVIFKDGQPRHEYDFILVFHEFKYVLVIEAKAGRLRFEKDRCLNERGDLQENPFTQARSAMHFLGDWLGQPKVVDYLVWFPDTKIHVPEIYAGHYIDSQHPEAAFKEFINKALSKKDKKQFPDQQIILETLRDHQTRHAADRPEIQLAKKTLENNKALLCANAWILSVFERNSRVGISGTAGTGKTMYAQKLASHFAGQGKSVLLLCYNILLGRRLAGESEGRYTATDLATFFQSHGVEVKTGKAITSMDRKARENYFRQTLPEEFIRLLKTKGKSRPSFDILIIDEGQDFNNYQIKAVMETLKHDGSFFYFYDQHQVLYKSKHQFSINQFVQVNFSLNLRNSRKIFDQIQREYLEPKNVKVALPDDVPEGRIKSIQFENANDLNIKMQEEITSIFQKDPDLSVADIIILVGDNTEDFAYLETFKFLIRERVVTVSKFGPANSLPSQAIGLSRPSLVKGLEFSVVFIIDKKNWKTKYDDSDLTSHLYTAMTRAKHQLFVFDNRLADEH